VEGARLAEGTGTGVRYGGRDAQLCVATRKKAAPAATISLCVLCSKEFMERKYLSLARWWSQDAEDRST
jgi:hypothetical protein